MRVPLAGCAAALMAARMVRSESEKRRPAGGSGAGGAAGGGGAGGGVGGGGSGADSRCFRPIVLTKDCRLPIGSHPAAFSCLSRPTRPEAAKTLHASVTLIDGGSIARVASSSSAFDDLAGSGRGMFAISTAHAAASAAVCNIARPRRSGWRAPPVVRCQTAPAQAAPPRKSHLKESRSALRPPHRGSFHGPVVDSPGP